MANKKSKASDSTSKDLPPTTKHQAIDKPSTKPMGMFLQDPALPTLHRDYVFAIDKDYLAGTGPSRFKIRDTSFEGVPLPAWIGQQKKISRSNACNYSALKNRVILVFGARNLLGFNQRFLMPEQRFEIPIPTALYQSRRNPCHLCSRGRCGDGVSRKFGGAD